MESTCQLSERVAAMEEQLRQLHLTQSSHTLPPPKSTCSSPVELLRGEPIGPLSISEIDFYINLLYRDSIGSLTRGRLDQCVAEEALTKFETVVKRQETSASVSAVTTKGFAPVAGPSHQEQHYTPIAVKYPNVKLRRPAAGRPVTPHSAGKNKKGAIKKLPGRIVTKKSEVSAAAASAESKKQTKKAISGTKLVVADSSSDVSTLPTNPTKKQSSITRLRNKIFGSSGGDQQQPPPPQPLVTKMVSRGPSFSQDMAKPQVGKGLVANKSLKVSTQPSTSTADYSAKMHTLPRKSSVMKASDKENVARQLTVKALQAATAATNNPQNLDPLPDADFVDDSDSDGGLHQKTPEALSFARRRNMWERRSLTAGFKFQQQVQPN